MARPKKAVAKVTEPKETNIIISKEQISELRAALERITEARRVIDGVEEADTLVSAGFKAGKTFSLLDKAEDMLDSIINELDPIDYSIDDEDDY